MSLRPFSLLVSVTYPWAQLRSCLQPCPDQLPRGKRHDSLAGKGAPCPSPRQGGPPAFSSSLRRVTSTRPLRAQPPSPLFRAGSRCAGAMLAPRRCVPPQRTPCPSSLSGSLRGPSCPPAHTAPAKHRPGFNLGLYSVSPATTQPTYPGLPLKSDSTSSTTSHLLSNSCPLS